MRDELEFREDHPLHGKEHLLDTHESHLEAYAEVLEEADPDDIHGVMLVAYGSDGADTFPSVSTDVDPRFASLWMLGAHIHHVASSAQRAGGSATMEEVAQDAIEYVRQHGFGDPEVRTDGGQVKTTDEIVLEQVEALDDEGKHGAPIGDVVEATLEESEARFSAIFETIAWLHSHGEIYAPARGYLRITPESVRKSGGGGA